jgi:hypothetical protein
MKLIYLACPYTHADPSIEKYRYETACRVAAKLMECGIAVFSPLSHSVPLVPFLNEKKSDHEFWMSVDLPILSRCDEVLILGLEGWKESRGVKEELFEAMALGIPVTLVEEKDIELLPNVPKQALRFKKSQIFKEMSDE